MELPGTIMSEETSGILRRILEEFELSNRCPPLKSSSSSLLELGSPGLSTKLTRAHNLWGAWVWQYPCRVSQLNISLAEAWQVVRLDVP